MRRGTWERTERKRERMRKGNDEEKEEIDEDDKQ